jgi:hypothetical protein
MTFAAAFFRGSSEALERVAPDLPIPKNALELNKEVVTEDRSKIL